MKREIVSTILLLLPLAIFGQSTIVIMTYNVLNFQGNNSADNEREDDLRTVIEYVNADIIVAEEIHGWTGYSNFLSDVLNYNDPGLYMGATFTDQANVDADIALFYKSGVVTFLSTSVVNTTNQFGQRDAIQFVMMNPQTETEFRLLGVHLKAGNDPSDEAERESEANYLRNHLNSLSSTTYFMVLGDLNVYGASEGAFQRLTESQSDNNGRVFDPINEIGEWHNNPSFSDVHTQATTYEMGGMDDRFDFILVSDQIQNQNDMNYVNGSYTAIGNDGNHFNSAINSGTNTAVPQNVADALAEASDHIPVVGSFQFPGESSYSIVINEIMQNPSSVSDVNGEWFEIYNAGQSAIDLRNWTIKDQDVDTHLVSGSDPVLLQTADYFVFGRNGDPALNGGLTVDYVYGDEMTLGNASDEVILLDELGNEVDRVMYDNGATFPDPNGASMALLDIALPNENGSNWVESTTPYGDGDMGTPGEVNFEGGNEEIEFTYSYDDGWALLGLSLNVENSDYQVLFPDAIEGTLYGYNGFYFNSTTLEEGNGYWLRMPYPGSSTISGMAISSLTIYLFEGWNLISGMTTAVAASDIEDLGGIIVENTVFTYEGTYVQSDSLHPGKAYWIRANTDGDIVFPN
tara:strand:- start:2085 stop:3977 length:1893 start_codon:yes stop_codon:yes gene_type:complete